MEPESEDFTIEEKIEYQTKPDGTKVKIIKKIKKIKKKKDAKDVNEATEPKVEGGGDKFYTAINQQSTLSKEKDNEDAGKKFQTEAPKKFGKQKKKAMNKEDLLKQKQDDERKKAEELILKHKQLEGLKANVEKQLEDIKLELMTNDKYEQGSLIGEGTFGKVFRAELKTNKKKIIVKEFKMGIDDANFNANSDGDFFREVKTQVDLEIEGIPKLYGYNLQKKELEKNDYTYVISLLLEPANGTEIRDIIRDFHKKFTQAERCEILQNIVSLVQKLHEKGYIHRDLKPENLILNVEEGEEGKKKFKVSLLDFGCSKKLSVGEPLTVTTTQHRGTLNYAPPEAHEGQEKRGEEGVVVAKEYEVTQGFDVWSLGCIIQEFFTLKPPFIELAKDQDNFKDYFRNKRLTTCEWGERKRTFFQYDNNIQNNRMIFDFCEKIFEFDPKNRPTCKFLIDELEVIKQKYIEKQQKK